MPSVRVKRRHAYASIQDDVILRPELPVPSDELGTQRRALYDSDQTQPSTVLSPSAASSSLLPRFPAYGSDPIPRRDMNRINRLSRRRSFVEDLDSTPVDIPPATYGRSTDPAAVPHPRRAYPQRVRSPLSSPPSDSDSEGESDSEDEDSTIEDDERHHDVDDDVDDDVVDYLDVIDPQVATVASLTNAANVILPPHLSFYSRKPVVTLPREQESEPDAEGASVHTASTDELDRHVREILKRRNKFRRLMRGVWAFLKAPAMPPPPPPPPPQFRPSHPVPLVQRPEPIPQADHQIYHQQPPSKSQTPHASYPAGPRAHSRLLPKETTISPPDDSDSVASELKSVSFPRDCSNRFASIASINTARNQETCGLLLGKYKGGRYVVTTLLIPRQHTTSDTFAIDEEGLVMQFTEERSLVILGWIHTHPTQSCFMSSIDLHMHSGFQRILPESFAVVCSPNSTPNFGIFRLTDPLGLQTIIECQATEAFHLHPERLYSDAVKGHVQILDLPLEIHDLREHKAQLRKPFALLSEGTLEFFKGSLSRYHHFDAGHIGEEKEEVTHAAKSTSGSERDETISEPGTPKQRLVSLLPTKTPAQLSNVSHKSALPSVKSSGGLALSRGTSWAAAASTLETASGLDMLHLTPESQLHGLQLDYLRILQDKFGISSHRYSCADEASACNEGDENCRKSFADPDNESSSVRCSEKSLSKRPFSNSSMVSSSSSQVTILN